MKELKITIVQTNLVWEDVQSNIDHLDHILQALGSTDIIALPEMFTTGFSMNASGLANDSYEKGLAFMKRKAINKNCAICGSLMCYEDGNYYNRFVWVEPNGEIKYYNKRHLFTMGDESKYYTKGNHSLLIQYKGWRLRPLICYDLRFPVWSRNTIKNPYDIILYVANWPEKRITQWSKLLQARAIENSCYVIGVNRIGVDGNGFAYTGMSMSVDFRGEAAILEESKEIIRTIIFRKDILDEYRQQFPVLNDADDFEIRKDLGGQ